MTSNNSWSGGNAGGNYTTGPFGNPMPFSNEQLENMSGSHFAMPLPDTGMMPGNSMMPGGMSAPDTTPGMNTTPSVSGMMPSEVLMNSDMPETLTNPIYTPGYLRTQLGKWMRVEFLIGNTLTDRVGRLVQVGASYILLQSIETSSVILGDIYAIKFITIYNNPEIARLYAGGGSA